MSSFNHIEKIKYTKNPDDVVALQEYIFFEDEREEEKFVVFKFMNNLNQRMRVLRFEVLQYDENHELLEKSVVVHENFVAEANAPFVPNAKLKVCYACKSLGVNLVYAEFDRVKWENGAFSENTYKFEKFAKDAGASAPAPAKKTVTAVTPAAKSPAKSRAGVKNEFRKNIAKFPQVFAAFVCIIVIAFVVVSLIFFRKDSEKFTLEDFDLERVSETTVDICGYDGFEKELTIPEKIGEYTVRKIKENAFVHSKIERVVFNTGEVIIEGNAFFECSSLVSVTAASDAGEIVILANGFRSCINLKTVDLPTAQLSIDCLNGCTGLTYLRFDCFAGSGSFEIPDLFGGAAEMPQLTVIMNAKN